MIILKTGSSEESDAAHHQVSRVVQDRIVRQQPHDLLVHTKPSRDKHKHKHEQG